MNDFKENEYTTIGYRVQELRKDKGWNQKELAEKLFVNLNFLNFFPLNY